MTTTLVLPSAIYNQVVIKSLYVAVKHDYLAQFLASNHIPNLNLLLNEPSEDQSLLGLVALNGDCTSVVSLIKLGSNPMGYSRIVIHDDDLGLPKDDDHHNEKYLFDLAIIARKCSFETYTEVVDLLSVDDLNISELIEDFIAIHLEDFNKYLEYLLVNLRDKNRLDLVFQPKYNYFLRKVYEHHPDSFKLLCEYGLTLQTVIDCHTTVADLIK